MILIAILVFLGLFWLVFRDSKKGVTEPITEDNLCSSHTWEVYASTGMLVCSTCGYISGKDTKLNEEGIIAFKRIQKERKRIDELAKTIEDLKERFYTSNIDGRAMSSEDKRYHRQGFDLYASFVASLPLLLSFEENKTKVIQEPADKSNK